MLVCVKQGWQSHCGRMWEVQSSWVCLKEGKEKPQKVKDVCLFIVEVNMGSRLERVLL